MCSNCSSAKRGCSLILTRPKRVVILLLLLLAACGAAAAPPRAAAWGPVITLAQAPQTEAPAILPLADRLVAAWSGVDAQGAHQSVRALTNEGLSEARRLPLPVYPFAQAWAPAAAGGAHLFWLDSNVNGETWLWVSTLAPDLTPRRELVALAEMPTWRFAVLPAAVGSAWAFGIGGPSAEPEMQARLVDGEGRPRPENVYGIAYGADWPAPLLADDGRVWLVWLNPADGQVLRGVFVNGALEEQSAVGFSPPLATGDLLTAFRAGRDATHIYLFWTITQADGGTTSWWSGAPLDSASFPPAERLALTADGQQPFETGFNGGAAQAAASGGDAAIWAAPLMGPVTPLPAAAQVGQTLGLVYFAGGELVGWQPVVELSRGLIGMPTLATDRDRHLYLAWAEPVANTHADLNLTLTRQGW